MRIGKHRTSCAECINVRRDRQFVLEHPHACAQVIHRNEQHIWPLRRLQDYCHQNKNDAPGDHQRFMNAL